MDLFFSGWYSTIPIGVVLALVEAYLIFYAVVQIIAQMNLIK